MIYLMQLTNSHTFNARNRILFVYYCVHDVTRHQGWKIYRYSAEKKPSFSLGSNEPVFGEMNQLSSWVDDLTLFPTNTDELVNNSLRLILDTDTVQEDYDVHSIVLFEKYKNKSKDEIDEEDLADFHTITYSEDKIDDSDEDDLDDDSELDEEVEAINNFHKYISSRPNTLLRVNKGGNPISFTTNLSCNLTCARCNSPLTFELQLLPNVVKYLKRPSSTNSGKRSSLGSNISMCLGGVVFYTCGSDCLTSELVEEHSSVLLYQ